MWFKKVDRQTEYNYTSLCVFDGLQMFTGQSVPIPHHPQTRAKNAGLVTLEI